MPVTVEGVLDSAPAGASKGKAWSLIFHLMPWQRKLAPRGQPLPTKPLRVEIPMTKRALDGWLARLEEGETVRVALDRVRLFDKRALWWFGIAKHGPRKIARPATLRPKR